MIATHTQLNRQLFLREFTCHQLLLSGMFLGDVYQWKFPPRNTCVSLQSPHCEIIAMLINLRLQYCTCCKYTSWSLPSRHGFYASAEHICSHISARVLKTLSSRDTSEVGLGSLCGYSAKKERNMEIMSITMLLTLALLWPSTPAMTSSYWLQFVHPMCAHNTLNHGRCCVWEVHFWVFHKLLQYLMIVRALEWFSVARNGRVKVKSFKLEV